MSGWLESQGEIEPDEAVQEVTAASFNLGCCCAGVSCGPPLHVANGVVRGAVFQFGDVAAYSCFGGYAMEGVGRSRCLENGTWTPPPKCRGREETPRLCVWLKGLTASRPSPTSLPASTNDSLQPDTCNNALPALSNASPLLELHVCRMVLKKKKKKKHRGLLQCFSPFPNSWVTMLLVKQLQNFATEPSSFLPTANFIISFILFFRPRSW